MVRFSFYIRENSMKEKILTVFNLDQITSHCYDFLDSICHATGYIESDYLDFGRYTSPLQDITLYLFGKSASISLEEMLPKYIDRRQKSQIPFLGYILTLDSQLVFKKYRESEPNLIRLDDAVNVQHEFQ